MTTHTQHVERIRAAAYALGCELLAEHAVADADLQAVLELAIEGAVGIARAARSLDRTMRVLSEHVRETTINRLRRQPDGCSLEASVN